MKIGLYFGSFNPLHNAHLMVANYVVDSLLLDKLKFIVSPQNPFKINYDLCDVEHRINMANLAINGNDKLEVSDIETKLPIPSYTIDTLHKIIEEGNKGDEYFLIMGFDNFVDIEKWKNYDEVIKLANIVVLPRVSDISSSLEECKTIFNAKLENIIKKIPSIKKIILLDEAPMSTISSSFIRHKISVGESISEYVPNEVEKYISTNSLFQTTITISIYAYNALVGKIRSLEQSLSVMDKKNEELKYAEEKFEILKNFLNDGISFAERMFQWKKILDVINKF